jgi:hypothetical protein
MCTRWSPSAVSARAIAGLEAPSVVPTSATMPRCRSTATSPRAESPATRSSSGALSSTVSDTDTSEVATTSTGVRCAAKTSNTCRRKPCAMSMRVERTRTIEMPLLAGQRRDGARRRVEGDARPASPRAAAS